MKRKSGDYSDYHMTTKEIGILLGISAQRVQQIIDRAFEKIRKLRLTIPL